ncbi:MAG TPA: type II toxin-antitoxin system RelE/ParE family toxin [Gammaproteobacteria bacterium]|nr:type II toxin-antitoxin system RelE/ParE family toxin [Gammaproteobacteria bacterium]
MTAYWTRKARHRLQQLYDYIAADQPLNAQRFVDRLTRRADALAEHPLRGQVVEKYQRDDIREVYEGRYRMIYRVLPDRIDILTVRHGARLLPDRLRDL